MNITQKIGAGFVTTAMLLGAFAMPAMAANNGTDQIGPIAGASQDGGSCGVPWANDTYNLFFKIHDNGDGTFDVRTEYKDASFETLAGQSPGACSTANHHGTLVTAGVKGNFQGFVTETVTGTYNPGAFSTAACPITGCTRSNFITQVFGAGATETFKGFNFEYDSSDSSLAYHHWQDKSDTAGNDVFVGDIATQ